jgi:hypothetical protein
LHLDSERRAGVLWEKRRFRDETNIKVEHPADEMPGRERKDGTPTGMEN